MRYNSGVTGTWFIGADLAWREGTAGRTANETGAAITGGDGQILDAGRTRGAGKTTGWADRAAEGGHAVMFADAPLVVASETSQRLRETQAGQRLRPLEGQRQYRDVHSPRLAGMQFLRLAGLSGGGYSDVSGGSPRAGRLVSETCPYATLADAAELAMTPNGVATSASRRMFRPARGGPSALPTATR